MNKQKQPRVLIYDLETSPNLAAVWGAYEQDVVWYEQEWYILTVAYKWLGEKKTHVISLPQYKTFKKDQTNDIELVKDLHTLFDEADVVIAHNAVKFDNRKSNARFLFHGMNPPSSYKTIDTLKVARKYFKMNKNHLNSLGEYLGVGVKVETGGYKLWKGCLDNKKESWRLMCKYNKQDVDLLEKVYLKLRPWITNHPALNLISGETMSCPKCQSTDLTKRGFNNTKTQKYQAWQCKECGGWCQSRKAEKIDRVEFTN